MNANELKVEAQHTPGPWKIVGGTEVRAGGDVLCDVSVDDARMENPEWLARREADARLIAAAPDLLAVLTALVDMDDAPADGPIDYMDRCEAVVARARAALAKARGTK